jgi:hypothetical protein
VQCRTGHKTKCSFGLTARDRMDTNNLLSLSIANNHFGKSSSFLFAFFSISYSSVSELARSFARTEFLLQAFNAQCAMAHHLEQSLLQSVGHLVELADRTVDLEGKDFPRQTPDAVFDAVASLVSTVQSPSFQERVKEARMSQDAFDSILRLPGQGIDEGSPMDLSRPFTPIPVSSSIVFPSMVGGQKSPSPKLRSLKRPRLRSSTPTARSAGLGELGQIPESSNAMASGSTLPSRPRVSAPLAPIASASSQDPSEGDPTTSPAAGPSQPLVMTVFPSQPSQHAVLRKKKLRR